MKKATLLIISCFLTACATEPDLKEDGWYISKSEEYVPGYLDYRDPLPEHKGIFPQEPVRFIEAAIQKLGDGSQRQLAKIESYGPTSYIPAEILMPIPPLLSLNDPSLLIGTWEDKNFWSITFDGDTVVSGGAGLSYYGKYSISENKVIIKYDLQSGAIGGEEVIDESETWNIIFLSEKYLAMEIENGPSYRLLFKR